MTTLDALAADIAQAVVEHGFNPRALDEEDAWNMGRAEQAVAARLERALPKWYAVHRVARGVVQPQIEAVVKVVTK